jgi:hypothetical protein
VISSLSAIRCLAVPSMMPLAIGQPSRSAWS